MDYALLVVFTAAIAVGVVSAVTRTWSLHRRVYSLEDRLSTVEGITQREVKIRAATVRHSRPSAAEESVLLAMQNPPQPKSNAPWWVATNLVKGQVAR